MILQRACGHRAGRQWSAPPAAPPDAAHRDGTHGPLPFIRQAVLSEIAGHGSAFGLNLSTHQEPAHDRRRPHTLHPRPNRMTMERQSERELVVTRRFSTPPRRVFDAWTQADQFRRWWVPKSFGLTLLACELDVRAGGSYRLVFSHPDAPDGMAFHGRYLDVTPPSRIVWTNEEAGGTGQITTVTFEAQGDQTWLVVHDLYPTQEALDADLAAGSTSWNDETFDQLDELLSAGVGWGGCSQGQVTCGKGVAQLPPRMSPGPAALLLDFAAEVARRPRRGCSSTWDKSDKTRLTAQYGQSLIQPAYGESSNTGRMTAIDPWRSLADWINGRSTFELGRTRCRQQLLQIMAEPGR